MVDETRDGDGGSIIASGVSRHSSDSPPDTKRVDETVEGVDIISSMPHEILHHILSFISTQLAIRTSALSRGWRHVWCHTPCLEFDCFNKYGHWAQLNALDINQTLRSYRAPKITRFHLNKPIHYRNPQSEMNSWMEFVVSRNVEKLYLVLDGSNHYRLPDLFYRSSSLEKLSVNFDMIPECTVSWKSLRKLALRSCNLNDESIDNILSGSPMLETLRLIYCTGPQRLDLSKSRTLRRLKIHGYQGHMDIDGNDDQRLDEIVAPHIHYLKLRSSYKPLTLVDVSCLMEANLDIFRRHSTSWALNTPFKEKADFLQTGVLKMLAKLQNAERLSFGGSLLQILSLAELRGVSFPTFKVQTLTLKTRFAKSFVPGITRLLHNSPGLKKLIVVPTHIYDIDIEDWYLDNYLNSQGLNPDQCWRSKYDVFPTSDESDMIGPESKAAAQLVRVDGIVDVILRHLKKSDEEIAMEIAWIIVYLSALSDIATSMLLKGGILQLLVERLASSDSLQLLIPVLRSLGNLVSVDPKAMLTILIGGKNTEESVIGVLAKCLRSEHRVLKKEAAWVLSNIAAGSIEHKRMIHSTEEMPLLIELLSTSPFDIRKEVAYVLGNLCVESAEGDTKPRIIQEHLVSIVSGGCLPGFINLVRSPDIEAARLGLQFIELVLRGMPNGEGSMIVEGEDGIDAMERFQFHENEELRVMANSLVDKYFGEDYGINE